MEEFKGEEAGVDKAQSERLNAALVDAGRNFGQVFERSTTSRSER